MCPCSTLSLSSPQGNRLLQAHNILSLYLFQPLSPKHNPEVTYIPGQRDVSMCSFYFFLIKHLKCEITIGFHTVVIKTKQNKKQCALHSVPPNGNICETIAQHHNWDVDTDNSQDTEISITWIPLIALLLPHTLSPQAPFPPQPLTTTQLFSFSIMFSLQEW